MAQARKIQTEGMRDAFRYSPGDRHTYTWDGANVYAAVWRHQVGTDGTITMVRAREAVPMDGAARTATAFSAAVDQWRAGRVTGEPPQP